MLDFQTIRSAPVLVLSICLVSVVHVIAVSTQGWYIGLDSLGIFPEGNIPGSLYNI